MLKEVSPITKEDLDFCKTIKKFIESLSDSAYRYKPMVVCDKNSNVRIKDFCITFPAKDNYWFEVEWYNLTNHITKATLLHLCIITRALKDNAKDLGIKDVQRRGMGIIFNRRKK